MKKVAGKWKLAALVMVLSVLFIFGGGRQAQAAEKCKVIFANSSGVVSTSTYKNWGKTVNKGETITLPKYSVAGCRCYWVLKSDDGDKKYAPGAAYRVTSNVKFRLYRYKEYSVRFYTADGSREYTSLRKTVIKGQNLKLPSVPGTSKSQGIGWSTSKKGRVTNKGGSSYKISGSKKFYAVTQKATSVSLRTQNGASYKTVYTTSGTAVFPAVDVSRPGGDGSMFLGWSRQRGKSTAPEYYAGDKIPSKTGTYYMVVFTEKDDVASLPSVVRYARNYKKVYFVGDSRTAGMERAMRGKTPSGIEFVCEPGKGITWFKETGYKELLSKVKHESKSTKKAVIINLGANDLNRYTSYPSFLKSVAKELKKYNCKMFYMSVNPVNSAMIHSYLGRTNRTEAQVDRFNSYIRANLCSGTNNYYTYMNTCSYFKKYGWISSRNNTGIHDGVHYSNETYRRIYDYAMRFLNR